MSELPTFRSTAIMTHILATPPLEVEQWIIIVLQVSFLIPVENDIDAYLRP